MYPLFIYRQRFQKEKGDEPAADLPWTTRLRNMCGLSRIRAVAAWSNLVNSVEPAGSGVSWLLVVVTEASLVFGTVVMWYNYLVPDGVLSSWLWMAALLVPQVLLVCIDCRQHTQPSFAYALHYSVLIVRTPDFLGHVTVQLFTYAESTALLWYPHWILVVKLAMRVLYFGVTQLYFNVLYRVCSRMGPRDVTLKFLFLGQAYYYMLWYMVIGVDDSTTWLFWAMLLFMNAAYVLDAVGWSTLALLYSGCVVKPGPQPQPQPALVKRKLWCRFASLLALCRQPWALCRAPLPSEPVDCPPPAAPTSSPGLLPSIPSRRGSHIDDGGLQLPPVAVDGAGDAPADVLFMVEEQSAGSEARAVTPPSPPSAGPSITPTPVMSSHVSSPSKFMRPALRALRRTMGGAVQSPPQLPQHMGDVTSTPHAPRITHVPRTPFRVRGASVSDTTAADDLLFRIRAAEQDTLADMCCLVLVAVVLTTLNWFADASPVRFAFPPRVAMCGCDDAILLAVQRIGAPAGYANLSRHSLWFKFLVMGAARYLSARVSRAVFHSRIVIDVPTDAAIASPTSASANLTSSFWLYVAVLLSCAYACFQTDTFPTRLSFVHQVSP